jgi:predicted membrane-bound spermidine synthase
MNQAVLDRSVSLPSPILSKEIKISIALAVFGLTIKAFLSYLGVIEYSFKILMQSFWQVGTLSSVFSYASVLLLSTNKQRNGKILWLLSGITCFVYLLLIDNHFFEKMSQNLPIILLTQGLVSFCVLIFNSIKGNEITVRNFAKEQIFIILLIALVSLYGFSVISITSAISPITYDLTLYHFDLTLGFSASVYLSQFMQNHPNIFAWIIVPVYIGLPLGMGLQYMRQRQSTEPPKVYLLLYWFSSIFIVCLFAYLLLPATGPKYIFGNLFPNNMPDISNILTSPVVNHSNWPRNAFPSMHFGWAFTMWLNALLMKEKWQSRLFLVITIITIAATLGLGEHYLIDLIVAVPFSFALQATFLRGLPITDKYRWQCILANTGLWLAWVVCLRMFLSVFINIPILSWVAVLATLIVSSYYYRHMIKAQELWFASAPKLNFYEFKLANSISTKALRPVTALFILSGFSGLIYEVVFSKELALIFGSSSIATYTVLATYMGGMALGAGMGGWVAEKIKRPLMAYVFCEMSIGIYCVITPFLFSVIQSIYLSMATGMAPDASILTVYRLVLGAFVLLPPTILMGITLPLLLAYCKEKQGDIRFAIANLYAANTIGAAIGALLAGYFIIPHFGINLSTAIAAALNFLVALLGIQLFKKQDNISVFIAFPSAVNAISNTPSNHLGWQALVALFFGGMITLALEIKYMFLLAVVAGNSTYAFSLMLFTFLFGLAAGAALIRPFLKNPEYLGVLFAWLEFALAGVILLGIFSWESMPAYFESFANYPSAQTFGAREFIRGLVCFCAMFPPALLIGALYPVTMNCVTLAFPNHTVRALGMANALNTLGNICGVLIASFILLPRFGALLSLQYLAAIAFALGLLVTLTTAQYLKNIGIAVCVILLFYIQPKSFNYTALASGANVYFAPQNWGEVIDHSESIDGGLTTVSLNKTVTPPVKILLTNGKFQGNNSEKGEMQAQTGFALAPLLHTNTRERALVIGYGTGATSRVLHEAGFKNLDIVDLSADIVRLANQHFSIINKQVTDQQGVSTYITDGRNYLLLTDKSYDLIGMEITSIWFSGAASLYNQNFYALAKRKLKADGVLQQWIQLHHTQLNDLLSVLASVRSEFKYVWLYEIGGQGIIVATNDSNRAPKQSNVDLIENTLGLKQALAIYNAPVSALLQKTLLTPASLERFLNKIASGDPAAWVSTDNNLYLEYETPKGNVLDGAKSFAKNIELIKKFSAK